MTRTVAIRSMANRCGVVLVFAVLGSVAPVGAGDIEVPLVINQRPAGSGADAECPDGSRLVRLDLDGTVRVLTEGFVAACDPDVSFDGSRVLFSGRPKAGAPLDIFEVAADGSSVRRLTRDLGDCREPLYLPRASVNPPRFDDPVPWMAFTSTAAGVLNEQGTAPATSLYVTNLEPVPGRGTVLWRTTYTLGGDVSPARLNDGRVVFSSRQGGRVKLMTVTWAGDNLNLFTEARPDADQLMVSEIPGQRAVVLVEASPGERSGRLVEVSLRRPLELRTELGADGDRYLTPHALSDGRILVAGMGVEGDLGIFLFDRTEGRMADPVYDDPDFDEVDAMPVAAHPEPIARIPMLEFASVLDIEGFEHAGQLHCLSVYDSTLPEIRDLPPGSVRWARFVRGVGLPVADAEGCREPATADDVWPPPCIQTEVLGVAPVEPDGSFFVNISGNEPFYIELLDQHEETLASMRSWIWIRSKGQRGCIGCHENRELAPMNRVSDALVKMRPTLVTGDSEEGSPASALPGDAGMMPSHEPTTGGATP